MESGTFRGRLGVHLTCDAEQGPGSPANGPGPRVQSEAVSNRRADSHSRSTPPDKNIVSITTA